MRYYDFSIKYPNNILQGYDKASLNFLISLLLKFLPKDKIINIIISAPYTIYYLINWDKYLTEWDIKEDSSIIKYKEIVSLAVTHDGMALEFASGELKADREIVSLAVKQDGMALQFVYNDLNADREIVFLAVGQKGMALEFASDELKADREIVSLAVTHDGMALEFASKELKADEEIVFQANASLLFAS